jgi:acetyl-CoA synthetase
METREDQSERLSIVRTFEDYQRLYKRSIQDSDGFWKEQSEILDWFHPPHTVLDANIEETDFDWFPGGKLNVAFNCIDRHLPTRAGKAAFIWAKNEPGQYEVITYRKLKHEVGRLANVLKAHGVRRGDRVCLYLPMIPELAYAMLACARIGAVHCVIFGGFSSESVRDRLIDSGASVVITANEAPRGSKRIALKSLMDHAVEGLAKISAVLVVRRTDGEVEMREGRDHWLDDEMAKQRSACPTEWMDSEDPLFILHTSGSTGKPKGVLHTTAGYLLFAAFTHRTVFDLRRSDVHFCTADIGWITGHSYVVYGPLANGVTSVIFESVPNFPDAGRLWEVVDDTKATIIYTAPTALRSLLAAGDGFVKKHSRKSLRLLGTVGEPINPEVWKWYHDVVGDKRCPVVDTWWQTETGGVLISPIPNVIPTKPGSATLPFFGVEPVLVDEAGAIIEGNGVTGRLCLARPWPGQARTLYGDHRRFRQTYYGPYPNLYFTGDGCRRDEDGYYWITGRVDDVLNVSGHRIGTAEVESALVAHEAVGEAAVVGFPHDLKGTGICAFVTLRAESDWRGEQLIGALKEQVRHVIGPIATPDRVLIANGLPKTRSGKIMRRILRKIAEGQTGDFGDTSALADPGVVDELVALVNARPSTMDLGKARR